MRRLAAQTAGELSLQRTIWRGRRRFRRDPRYRIEFVRASAASGDTDDRVLLRRICRAYQLASAHHKPAYEAFTASRWWKIVQENNLLPVRRALTEGDVDSLCAMYRQFFRDPCGAGLVGLPVDMARSYRRPNIPKRYRHLLLIDALHRLNVWQEKTQGRFPIEALRGPETGAPFGVLMGNILLRPGAPDHHYYASKIIGLLRTAESPTVVEIGGGFGGMAYYLIRDSPEITYIDFDLPETVALASYYIAKSFPHLQVRLYGEETVCRGGIFLMPVFAMAEMLPTGADVVFSSHLFSDLAPAALQEYLTIILDAAPVHFLHVDGQAGFRAVCKCMSKNAPFTLAERQDAHWSDGCAGGHDEYEALYVRQPFLEQPSGQVSL